MREIRLLSVQALAPAQEDPAHRVGANGPSSGGDQWPPRHWDEFMTDSGTAGGSWNDCLCLFIL